MPTESPESFGPYTVLAPIGEGGGAFRVAHRDRGGEFALRPFSGSADVERFAAAARGLRELDHPALARVHDAGVAGGVPFVVTDPVAGATLADLVAAGGPLPFDEAVRLGRDVAGALAALHGRGLTHGRLGPDSVVRHPDGAFVLVDVDAALDAEDRDAAPHADQRGLGALLSFALTGAAEADESDRVSGLRPDVPGWLDVLVARCLVGEPRGHFEDLEDLERALRYAPPVPEGAASGPGALPDDPPPGGAAPDGSARASAPPPAAAPPLPVDPPRVVPEPAPTLSADPPRVAPDPPRVTAPAPPLGADPPRVGDGPAPPRPVGDRPREVAPPAPARTPPQPTEPAPDRRPLPPAVAALQERTAGDGADRAGRGGLRVPSRVLGPVLLAVAALAVLAFWLLRDDDETLVAAGPAEAVQGAPDRDARAAQSERPAPPDAAAAPPPDAPPPEAEPDAGVFTPDRARAVADAYLRTGNAGDPAAIGALYADRVQYYDRGSVARDDVLRDKAAYLRRWPERDYRRVSDVTVEPGPGGGSRLRFDYAYRVAGPGRGAEGEGWAELTVRPDGDAFEIFGEDGGVGARGGAAEP